MFIVRLFQNTVDLRHCREGICIVTLPITMTTVRFRITYAFESLLSCLLLTLFMCMTSGKRPLACFCLCEMKIMTVRKFSMVTEDHSLLPRLPVSEGTHCKNWRNVHLWHVSEWESERLATYLLPALPLTGCEIKDRLFSLWSEIFYNWISHVSCTSYLLL